MRKIDPLLHEQLRKLIRSMGYELIGCELLPQGRQMVLRIYIDQENSEKGVTVDNCGEVSQQVSAMLDVENPFPTRYTLEVSSPGIDRPLFEIEHYRRYIGRKVKIKLHSLLNGRRQFKGILKQVEDEEVYLLPEDSEEVVKLPLSMIEKANLIGEINL